MSDVFNAAREDATQGDLDWASDDIRVLLISETDGYTYDADDSDIDDVLASATEFSDASYSRESASGLTQTREDGADRVVLDMDDVVFSDLDGDEIDSAIVYRHVTDDTDSRPIVHWTSGDFPLTANGGDVTLEVDASDGVWYLD